MKIQIPKCSDNLSHQCFICSLLIGKHGVKCLDSLVVGQQLELNFAITSTCWSFVLYRYEIIDSLGFRSSAGPKRISDETLNFQSMSHVQYCLD